MRRAPSSTPSDWSERSFSTSCPGMVGGADWARNEPLSPIKNSNNNARNVFFIRQKDGQKGNKY